MGYDANPAFLGGIEEAWRVTGIVPMNDQAHERFAVWLEGSNVTVYDATPEASAPVWTGGPCPSFAFYGERFVCGTHVTDPVTYEFVELPLTNAMPLHSDGTVLVMLTDTGTAVAYDQSLTELWRVDNVAPIGATSAGLRTLPVVPADANPATAASELFAIDVATGQVLADGLPAQEAVDGYVSIDPGPGMVTASRWDGSESFRVMGEGAWMAPIPLFGRMISLADFQACVDLPDEAAPVTGAVWYCLVSGGVTEPAALTASGAEVGGAPYPGAALVHFFEGTDHVLVQGNPAVSPTAALYPLGSTTPVWEVPAEWGPIPMGDGSLLLVGSGPDTIIYRPAG